MMVSPELGVLFRHVAGLVGLEGGPLGRRRGMAQPRKGKIPSQGMLLISQGRKQNYRAGW